MPVAESGTPRLRRGGPLPRRPFCSFLATAVVPLPQTAGEGWCEAGDGAPRRQVRRLYPLPLAGEGASLSERVRAPRGRSSIPLVQDRILPLREERAGRGRGRGTVTAQANACRRVWNSASATRRPSPPTAFLLVPRNGRRTPPPNCGGGVV